MCRKPATLRHVLNGCPVALQHGRYTWRHSSDLSAIRHRLNTFWEQRSNQLAVQATNATKEKASYIQFVRAGQRLPEPSQVRASQSTPPCPKSPVAQTTCLPSHSPSSECLGISLRSRRPPAVYNQSCRNVSKARCGVIFSLMTRNLRQVHDLTLTRVRDSTVVAKFADVDMHAPPAFIMLMGSQKPGVSLPGSRP